ncbi:DUF2339 domain-containing protein [Edaphobacter albus]|uniref:DUF2339 domain-containing protein n=1 Tax=Edaphobacter sp. 4G125 TaxID=2763071 RepID=UPI001647428F|nr:DUF2339 domain-containing protein [Edaphobacter sp. 4G125]QNI36537.1 DUF2339 domain-containing protein [Edaphobacter sp. 4G125]
MGSEEFPQQPDRVGETSMTDELRLLTARVEALEREFAAMRASAKPMEATATREVAPRVASSPPPPPMPEQVFPSVVPGPVMASAGRSRPSLENRLGAHVFNRIGILALMVGATWFLKLAIDNQWIGPVGRILIGLIAGAGVVVWSERFRRKGFSAFSYSLKAIGTGVLYLSLWAAYQLYHLLPSEAALAGMILVTAWNAYMAWAQDSELLAAYALTGGVATPLLLSSGGNHEIFLFTYLLAIDVAIVALVKIKSWPRLLLGAFPATVFYFFAWYAKYYQEPAFAITTIFAGLFFLVFVSASVGGLLAEPDARRGLLQRLGRFTPHILLPLGNAAFVSLALYLAMKDSDRGWFVPWLMLILSAVYLLITRLPQSPVPAALHLSLAVVFLTIAIPLKASGHWITVAWLVEGVAILWVAARITSSHAEQPRPASDASNVLRWLSGASLVLGFAGLISETFWLGVGTSPSFFNRNLATAVIAAAAYAAVGWLALRTRRVDRAAWPAWSQFAFLSVIAVDLVALLLSLREIGTTWSSLPHEPFWNADFGMALVGLGMLAAVARFSWRTALAEEGSVLWAHLSGGSIIALNLIAIFTGVREIESIWPMTGANPDLELRRALAVSAFLMVYGAALLAVGFWRRTAFVRWQALILLVFTIGKTFLYDMRNLSQGYRVVSFLGLGVLLMAVSFAYQKDWLSLRGSNASNPAGSDQ